METILVTGGAGFIGSHVCEALLARGNNVLNIDNFNDFYNPEFKRHNVGEIISTCAKLGLSYENYKTLEGDIRNAAFLEDVFSAYKPTIVIHLAAYAGVRPSIRQPALYVDVNINGTVNILECLRKYEVKKFIFASSSSVYGNSPKIPLSEDDRVDCPISPYAATKKAGELICHTYHHLYNINTACLRFFTVYGPRQRPDLAIYKFTELMLAGKPIPFYGNGNSQRDYTFIGDIADGVLRAKDWVSGGDDRFGIFNLGESQMITLTEMVKAIEENLGLKAELLAFPQQPGDVEKTCADITNSVRILGYSPQTVFNEGIRRFIDWYKNSRL